MSDDNVIPIDKPKPAETYFEESIRLNKEKQDRLARERAKNNKNVKRSHRLNK